MIRSSLRQIKHSIINSVAFCLLLIFAGILFALGVGILLTSVSSSQNANNAFTTIALPDISTIRRFAENYVVYNYPEEIRIYDGSVFRPGDAFFNDLATSLKEHEITTNINETILTSDAINMDSRRVFGGYIPGVIPHISTPELFSAQGIAAIRSPNTTAAFIAVAENIHHNYMIVIDPELGEIIQEIIYVTFSVEETLLINSIYTPAANRLGLPPHIPKFVLKLAARNYDGTVMIEEGNRYFIFGRTLHYTHQSWDLIPPRLVPPGNGHFFDVREVHFAWLDLEPIRQITSIDDEPIAIRRFLDGNDDISLPTNVYSRVFSNDSFINPLQEASRIDAGFRWLIELPSDPTAPLTDELRTEIDELVHMGNVSVNSLIVLTTNRLESYYRFHQGQTRITQGRGFTRSELESGARVAIVNELTEGVNIGDTITLHMYESIAYIQYYTFHTQVWGLRVPYSPVSLVVEPMEFEVIGFYRTPLREFNSHMIPTNTIFIPDNSIPEFPFIVPELTDSLQQVLEEHDMSFDEWLNFTLPRTDMPIFNTVIIPNGETQAFSDAVNAILPAYAAFFRIYDQGFSNVAGALDNLVSSGILIVVVTFAGWLIALVVFILFYILRKKKEAGLLYVIGVKKADRFKWLFAQCLVIIFVSSALVFTVSSLLYERTVDYAVDAAQEEQGELVTIFTDAVIADDGVVIDFTIAPLPYAIPVAVIGQALVLLIISAIICGAIARKEGSPVVVN